MKDNKLIQIGTSGWHYKHWRNSFYPQQLSEKGWLAYYAQHFNTVEIHNSFYRLPSVETLRQWRDTVPAGFMFSVKASRYITYLKKTEGSSTEFAQLSEASANFRK